MRQVMAIILRELLIFKRKSLRYAFSFSISPLLYLFTFGWAAMGKLSVKGVDYITFMLPGLIAMICMMNSFSLSSEINISRFYWKTFDEIRSAPVPDLAYAAGEVLSGMFRGCIAAGIVIVLGLLFHVRIHHSAALWGSIALTTFVFASLAICAAMVARTHSDLGMLSSFIITPMAFLCGTFFPIDLYPKWVGILVSVLPLTPATTMIRATAEGRSFPTWAFAYLGIAAAICFSLAVMVVRQTRK